ncbi:MAG: hypothetical protein COA50_15645 [Flavobacteriaceae bacterium]|nr:MAG: hypothetical protein COA50_15645 [Flavobacteriaceae bacterium]
MKFLKKHIIYFIILTFLNCASSKDLNTKNNNCSENMSFKKEFYKKLAFLDSYYENQSKNTTIIDSNETFQNTMDRLNKTKSDYEKSLSFFSKHPKISYQYMGSYSGEIPYNLYLDEKKVWMGWYEENRCKNIQLKGKNKTNAQHQL